MNNNHFILTLLKVVRQILLWNYLISSSRISLWTIYHMLLFLWMQDLLLLWKKIIKSYKELSLKRNKKYVQLQNCHVYLCCIWTKNHSCVLKMASDAQFPNRALILNILDQTVARITARANANPPKTGTQIKNL